MREKKKKKKKQTHIPSYLDNNLIRVHGQELLMGKVKEMQVTSLND